MCNFSGFLRDFDFHIVSIHFGIEHQRKSKVALQAPFGFHFGGILEAVGKLLGPWGALGEVLEGSEKDVEKRGPPIEYRSHN